MAELTAIDDRQSLEGQGLLRIRLARPANQPPPSALTSLGLDREESWSLLAELVRSVRQQGALTMPDGVDPRDEAFDPRRGPIYVRGDGSDPKRKVISWVPTRGSNRRLDYLTRLLAVLGSQADPVQVLDECWAQLPNDWCAATTVQRLGAVRQVDHRFLALDAPSSADPVWRCEQCRRVAPVSVRGVCPALRCDGKLVPSVAVEEDGHYRHLYRTIRPVPMVVREHTAQLTSAYAADIQQQFVRGQVNALSCSTTFELGVDVGELQTVVLRNMPPTTANYVQRAGRAGRRTESAALAVTYAQRRSHDLSKYADPEAMIAGRFALPTFRWATSASTAGTRTRSAGRVLPAGEAGDRRGVAHGGPVPHRRRAASSPGPAVPHPCPGRAYRRPAARAPQEVQRGSGRTPGSGSLGSASCWKTALRARLGGEALHRAHG